MWRAPTGSWVFTRYADCATIFRDWKAFGRGGGRGSEGADPSAHRTLDQVLEGGTLMAHTLVGTDPPQHTRLRRLLTPVFSTSEIDRIRSRVVDIAHRLIDRVERRGEMDVMADYARPLPGMMITEMLGVDYGDAQTWEPWANAIHRATSAVTFLPEQAERATKDMIAARDARHAEARYFQRLIEDRRRRPGNDLITMLARVEEEGDRLDEIELLATLVVILGGGHHTSVSLIGNGVRAILANPDQLALLRSDPSMMGGLVEETLRLDPTLQSTARVAVVETEVSGARLDPGERAILVIGAANRDPEVFPDPDRFDIRRPNVGRHLAFAVGIHYCVGHALARAEATVAFEVLLERLPNLRLVETDPPHDGWWNLRGLERLPVRWDVTA